MKKVTVIKLMRLNTVLLEDTTKTHFLFRNHNSAKNHSAIIKLAVLIIIKLALELAVLISPETFHSNYISCITEVVQTNFKSKKIIKIMGHNSDKNIELENADDKHN